MAQFRLNGQRVLEVALDGDSVRAIAGSMVAYEGKVAFKNAGLGGGDGLKSALKRRVTGESLALMECSGHGLVYLAQNGTEIELVALSGQTLQVESSALLALQSGLRTDVTFTGLRGASSGQGLFTTTVTGAGTVAIMSDGPAIALEVSASGPLVVDPDAYVASMGQLTQSFVSDVSWKNLIGEGSGEAFSLQFHGEGVVYIQPAER